MTPTNGRRGQGLVEYVILVGLVAILLIAAVEKFSGVLSATFGASSQALDGHMTPRAAGGPGTNNAKPSGPGGGGGPLPGGPPPGSQPVNPKPAPLKPPGTSIPISASVATTNG